VGKTSIAINFLKADVTFAPKHKIKLRLWMQKVAQKHRCKIEQLDFIFCSDDYLLHINQQFLAHNTFTDIITFDYSKPSNKASKGIAGEIYISVERVKENAITFKTNFTNELHRVMIHGVLHICGFKDKKVQEQKEMRAQEDLALKVLERLI
jgi:rRNA maturation RNase YbeY